MSYPYPDLVPRLQIRTTPDHYQAIIHQVPAWSQGQNAPPPDPRHPLWTVMPRYTYAVCPLCATSIHDQLNTYSLLGWGYHQDLRQVPYRSLSTIPPFQYPQCQHYVGVQVFINLHQQHPGYTRFTNDVAGEVPYVTPWLLTDPISAYGVLSALPICCVTDSVFLPTFTVFFLSYFSADRETQWRTYWAAEAALYGHDPEWYPFAAHPERRNYTHPAAYDLTAWCRLGVLGWLDHTQPDLPLRLGPDVSVPSLYATIHGERSLADQDTIIMP